MPSTLSIIQFGLKLLKKGWLEAYELESYRDAFFMLGIDVSLPLKLAALKSVFSVCDDPAPKYYQPAILDPKHINYPSESVQGVEISGFDWSESEGSNELTMLEKYGTFVSVDLDELSQTPVFDLFKTAAAIDDCLKSGEGNEKFLLVGCDFSGIQDTVYTITSKGALKTLRARSFMLELLCEHIIHEILTAVGSDRHAVVYSGGGGFGLLLPTSDSAVEKINNCAATLNCWALNEFTGRLFIAIDALPCHLNELGAQSGYKELRQVQADRLDRLKRRKFIDNLGQLFTPSMPEQFTVATECQITRRDDLPDEFMFDIGVKIGERMNSVNKTEDGRVWVSESCFHQFKLGDKLVDAKNIYRYRTGVDRSKKSNYGALVLPGCNGQKVFYMVERVSGVQPELTWNINAWEAGPVIQYANYVRTHGELSVFAKKKEDESIAKEERVAADDDTATFQGLASSSCGADLIGALRMDVDNLGDMFSTIDNIGQLSVRSRMLNLFFKVYLNQICLERKTDILKKSEARDEAWGACGRNVSIIYSGGDDLFVVGAWDDTVELSFDIQQAFERFTYGRPVKDGGISGGLTLHQPKFPLYQMARLSVDAEAYAKHDDDGDGQPRKNRISLFYDHSKLHRKKRLGHHHRSRYMLSMEWTLAHAFLLPLMGVYQRCSPPVPVFKAAERKRMDVDKFSFSTIEKWFAVIEKYQQSNQLYLPTMARVMRGIEHEFRKDRNDTDLFEELVACLYTTEQGKQNWISHFHIALNWLSYLRRTA